MAMPAYGYQGRVAKQTTGYPSASPLYAPPVSKPAVSPYGGQGNKNTTGYSGDSLYPPVKPVTPPTSPTPSPTPGPATQPVSSQYAGFDPNVDPVYQMAQAQSAQASADAQSAALASQRQLGIQYGDADLLNRLGDTTAAQAAAENPYSVYGQLRTQQPKDAQALDEVENKNNLFYSGHRVNAQTDLAGQYGQQRANAAGQEQTALGQIQQGILDAANQGRSSVSQAYSDALNRWLQQLLSQPVTPATTSNGGGGGGYPGVDAGDPLSFNPPQDGPEAGYIPAGTQNADGSITAPGGGTYISGGGNVTYQSNKSTYGKKRLL